MSGVLIGIWIVAAAVSLAVFIALVKGGRPLRTAFTTGLQGIGALLAVNIAGIFTGVSLGINALSLVSCTVLGVPGVVTLLVLKTIFRLG